MKFSAQEEYGLRCLIQIARAGRPLTIPEISDLEGISSTHAAKTLMILRREGFVVASRGQSGGYSLAKGASEIAVGDVLSAIGGKLYDAEFCRKHAGALYICTHAVDCSVRSLWQIIQGAVDSVLDKVTLQDMVATEAKSNVTLHLEGRHRPQLAGTSTE
jgi:Rrf2 family protein